MKRTDFQKILTELNLAGMTDYQLSELTNIERTKITKLRNGTKKQPFYDDGAAIIKVYESRRDTYG